jgi:hypothetical protein
MSYSKQWSSNNPGLLLLLLDQSGSMNGRIAGENESKATFATRAINSLIKEIVMRNMDGESVRNRVRMSVIGYNNSAPILLNGMLKDFAFKPRGMQDVIKRIDSENGIIEMSVKQPYWITECADGGTNMMGAYKAAHEIIVQHGREFPEAPSPVVINLSDGEPNTGGECKDVQDFIHGTIWKSGTTDGATLTYNMFLSDRSNQSIDYPSSLSEIVLCDEHSRFMFESSSIIPAAFWAAATHLGIKLKENSRGCVINHSGDSLVKFIRFGSSVPEPPRPLPPAKNTQSSSAEGNDRPSPLADTENIR